MTEPFGRLRRFLRELKRRNVYKVAVTYAAVVFVGLQAVRLLVPATTLPGWADELLIAFAVLGFPIAVVLAWAFEMTAEGMRRTETREGEESGGAGFQWIGLTLVIVLAGGVWYVTTEDDGGSPTETASSVDTVQTAEAPTEPSAARDDRPFVAVLPLENLSPSEENAFFAAGVHEEILGQLSKVSGLGVFARTTMAQYADTEKSVYAIGQELDAEAVLEGSVRRGAGRVRISAQLIDPQSRDHLWSQTYERELSPDAIFDIQADIAEQIAGALETRLTASEETAISAAPTPSMDAYDAFLKGRDHLWSLRAEFKPAALDSAAMALRRAVRRDPSFAQAQGLLGVAHGRRYERSNAPRWRDSALAAADRATDLRADVAEAHLARAVVHTETDSLNQAKEALSRVLEARPGHEMASQMMAEVHSEQGDRPEALRWALRTAWQAPRDPARTGTLIWMLLGLDFLDAAEAWARYGLEYNPDNRMLTDQLVWTLIARGERQKARATVQKYIEDHPDKPLALYAAGTIELYGDNPEEALELLTRAERRWDEAFPDESPTWQDVPQAPDWTRLSLAKAHLRAGDPDSGQAILAELASSYRKAIIREDVPTPRAYAGLARVKRLLGERGAVRDDLRLAVESGWTAFPGTELSKALRGEPWLGRIARKAAANLEAERNRVREMDLDLYPPGMNPDTATGVTVR